MHMTHLEAMDKMAQAAGLFINRLVRVAGYHGTVTYRVTRFVDPFHVLIERECGVVDDRDRLREYYSFYVGDIKMILETQKTNSFGPDEFRFFSVEEGRLE